MKETTSQYLTEEKLQLTKSCANVMETFTYISKSIFKNDTDLYACFSIDHCPCDTGTFAQTAFFSYVQREDALNGCSEVTTSRLLIGTLY